MENEETMLEDKTVCHHWESCYYFNKLTFGRGFWTGEYTFGSHPHLGDIYKQKIDEISREMSVEKKEDGSMT